MSKLLEKHICDVRCEHHDISDQQWGFRACKFTTNGIVSTTNEWFIHLEIGAEVQAVFYDFQKAFNSVPHCLFDQQTPPSWTSLVTQSGGSPVNYTIEFNKLVFWENFHLQLLFSQVYHRGLFWDHCCS